MSLRHYRNNRRGALLPLLSGALVCCYSVGATPEAQDAVRAWYETIDDASDQPRLMAFGTVGAGFGPLERAYEQLSPILRAQLPKEDFLLKYRGLAQLRLLQVHPIETDTPSSNAEVFVEEERTMVIEGTPVLAWFDGRIALTSSGGTWQISAIKDIKPEDIISPLGGHMPWREDPEAVARAASQCGTAREECMIKTKAIPQNTSKSLGKVTVQTHQGTMIVSMAKLHSGVWLPLATRPEAPAARK